ncbi:MAG: RNA polymerase sigma factor [Pseudomonadota bacterium]
MKNNCGPPDADWTRALSRLRNHFFDRDIEPFRPVLKAHCLKLTRNPSLAEDLMQEALIRSLALCRICGGPTNIRAYILRTATNLWIDELRKKQRANRAMETMTVTQPPMTHEPAEPLLELIAAELPPREFEALILTTVYGYTGLEAAQLLKTTPAAVKMASSRARKKLRSIEQRTGVFS